MLTCCFLVYCNYRSRLQWSFPVSIKFHSHQYTIKTKPDHRLMKKEKGNLLIDRIIIIIINSAHFLNFLTNTKNEAEKEKLYVAKHDAVWSIHRISFTSSPRPVYSLKLSTNSYHRLLWPRMTSMCHTPSFHPVTTNNENAVV
jgi:hypothetical protein